MPPTNEFISSLSGKVGRLFKEMDQKEFEEILVKIK